MSNEINNRFVFRDEKLQYVPKEKITLWEKVSGKTNLSKVLQKIKSSVQNEEIQSGEELSKLKGRIINLEDHHQSKLKNSALYRLVSKALHTFFGYNLSNDCKMIKKKIDKKQSELATFKPLSSKGKIPLYQLSAYQKKLSEYIKKNNYVDLELYLEKECLDQQHFDETVEFLVRNCSKEQVVSFLKTSIQFNPKIRSLGKIISKSSQGQTQLIKNVILELGSKDLPNLDKNTLRNTIELLEPFGDYEVFLYLKTILNSGNSEAISTFQAIKIKTHTMILYNADQYLNYLSQSDIDSMPAEQLKNIIQSGVFNYSKALRKYFDQNVAEKLLDTKDSYFDLKESLNFDQLSQPDFIAFVLRKCFEYEGFKAISSYKLGEKRDVVAITNRILEQVKERSDIPFLLACYNCFTQKGLPQNHGVYVDISDKISELAGGENPAEVLLNLYSDLLQSKEQQGYKLPEGYETKDMLLLTKGLKEKGMSIDVLRNVLFPMSFGRVLKPDMASMEEALEKYLLINSKEFEKIRDLDELNKLIDFLIDDNATSKHISRTIGVKKRFPKAESTGEILQHLLSTMRLPEDAAAYAFVLQRLVNFYSVRTKKSVFKFNNVQKICEKLESDLPDLKPRFSYEVFEKLGDDYKPMYLFYSQPTIEGKLIDYLNQLKVNKNTALTWEIIIKRSVNKLASQFNSDNNLFDTDRDWSPELLLVLHHMHFIDQEHKRKSHVPDKSTIISAMVTKEYQTDFKTEFTVERLKKAFKNTKVDQKKYLLQLLNKAKEIPECKEVISGMVTALFHNFTQEDEVVESLSEKELKNLLGLYKRKDPHIGKIYFASEIERLLPCFMLKTNDHLANAFIQTAGFLKSDRFDKLIKVMGPQNLLRISQEAFHSLSPEKQSDFMKYLADTCLFLVKYAIDDSGQFVDMFFYALDTLSEKKIHHQFVDHFFSSGSGVRFLSKLNEEKMKRLLSQLPETPVVKKALVELIRVKKDKSIKVLVEQKIGPYKKDIKKFFKETQGLPLDYFLNTQLNKSSFKILSKENSQDFSPSFVDKATFFHNVNFSMQNYKTKNAPELIAKFIDSAKERGDKERLLNELVRYLTKEGSLIDNEETLIAWLEALHYVKFLLKPQGEDAQNIEVNKAISPLKFLQKVMELPDITSKRILSELTVGQLRKVIKNLHAEDTYQRFPKVAATYLNNMFWIYDAPSQKESLFDMILDIHKLGISDEVMEAGCNNPYFGVLTKLTDKTAGKLELNLLENLTPNEYEKLFEYVDIDVFISNMYLLKKHQSKMYDTIRTQLQSLKNAESVGSEIKVKLDKIGSSLEL